MGYDLNAGDDTERALIAKAAPLRVMALGDSITAGANVVTAKSLNGGYRGPLERLLQRNSYRATFVGSCKGFWFGIGGRAHEGWPGYVLRSYSSDPGPGQLCGSLTQKAMQASDPDVVLLMAGTNDLLRHENGAGGYTLANIVASMNVLIEQIVTTKPNVFVIVAPVVASPKLDLCTLRAFNGVGGVNAAGGLKALVDAYNSRGYRVSFAPAMATSVPRDAAHFPDGIHPCGAGGYTLMAHIWLRAIEAITQTAPSDAPR
jgi:lysophospholipase L1-like esterase